MIWVKISFSLVKNSFRFKSFSFVAKFFHTVMDDHTNYIMFPMCHYQLMLLLLALVAVPWMLFPKPFLLKKQHQEVRYLNINFQFISFVLRAFDFLF